MKRTGRCLILILLLAAAWVPGRDASKPVEAVLAVGFTVSDMDRSVEFYSQVLSFVKVSDVEVAGDEFGRLQGVFPARARVVRMRLGEELIELTEYITPRGRPIPQDSRSNDLWFQHIAIIVSDMGQAYQRLRRLGVEHTSPEPQTIPEWNKNAAGIRAFYFKDPDRHNLEILQFPAGKGDPRWQSSDGRLFLGIDHTAIAVSDTQRSLAFYRDVLGFEVAGQGENYGPEQERLNAVFGARLLITSLKAPRGPSIEFLEYLAPGGGRPYPPDWRPNDLAHWQVRLETSPAAVPLQGRLNLISPGWVGLHDAGLGYSRGLLFRDPDGHALLLTVPAEYQLWRVWGAAFTPGDGNSALVLRTTNRPAVRAGSVFQPPASHFPLLQPSRRVRCRRLS